MAERTATVLWRSFDVMGIAILRLLCGVVFFGGTLYFLYYSSHHLLALMCILGTPLVYSWVFASIGLFPLGLNSTEGMARRQISNLIGSANRRIRITSGTLAPGIYESELVSDTIRKAIKRNVDIEIILLEKHPQSLGSNHWTNNENIRVYHVPVKARHLLTVDGLHTRIERFHDEDAKILTAVARYYSPMVAEAADAEINRLIEIALSESLPCEEKGGNSARVTRNKSQCSQLAHL